MNSKLETKLTEAKRIDWSEKNWL